MTIFLKPCPHCGSTASIDDFPISEHVATIKCNNSKCGSTMIRAGMSRKEAINNAVNAWNQRAEA